MDKITFIHWLLDRFNVSDNNLQREVDFYFKKLQDNIIFEKLKEKVIEQCSEKPGYIELNKMAFMNKLIIKETPRCYALKHFDYIKSTSYKGTMADLPEETKDKVRAFLKKVERPCNF